MRIHWHVGDVVRKLREQRKWTQLKLGDKAGLNKATIVALEEGVDRDTKRSTFEKVAQALGISVRELHALVPDTPASGSPQATPAAAEDPPTAAAAARERFRPGGRSRDPKH